MPSAEAAHLGVALVQEVLDARGQVERLEERVAVHEAVRPADVHRVWPLMRGSPGAATAGPARTTLRAKAIAENFMAGYLKPLGGFRDHLKQLKLPSRLYSRPAPDARGARLGQGQVLGFAGLPFPSDDRALFTRSTASLVGQTQEVAVPADRVYQRRRSGKIDLSA